MSMQIQYPNNILKDYNIYIYINIHFEMDKTIH